MHPGSNLHLPNRLFKPVGYRVGPDLPWKRKRKHQFQTTLGINGKTRVPGENPLVLRSLDANKNNQKEKQRFLHRFYWL